MYLVASHTIWGLTLAFTFFAGWLDQRTHRIPNWLTAPALLAGVIVHSFCSGWRGAGAALEGAVLGLLILLPLVLFGPWGRATGN